MTQNKAKLARSVYAMEYIDAQPKKLFLFDHMPGKWGLPDLTIVDKVNIFMQGNVNECRTVLVKNLIKESFYEKRKKKI